MGDVSVVLGYGSQAAALGPGTSAVVGRGVADDARQVRLGDATDLSRRAAIVAHDRDGRWTVEAVSSTNGVAVRHASGSVVQVPTGTRRTMPEWFDPAYLVITAASAEYEVKVEVVEGDRGTSTASRAAGSAVETELVLPRDLARADYRTALCLCEPMLDDPFNRRVPTEGEIARRLNELGAEDGEIVARTVERRLARLRERTEVPSNAALRDRLVAAGLVTAKDLARLRSAGS